MFLRVLLTFKKPSIGLPEDIRYWLRSCTRHCTALSVRRMTAGVRCALIIVIIHQLHPCLSCHGPWLS